VPAKTNILKHWLALLANSTSKQLKALKTQAKLLWQDGCFFVPIRHHSPGCAMALKHLLAEIKPKTILIEAPKDCQHLVAACKHPETTPPVAFFCQKGEPQNRYSAYFPMCEYSPEWQAMKVEADIRFIDLPYEDRENEDVSKTVVDMMSDRYLAHSDYLTAIAKKQGCTDQYESWDQLFEQRSLAQLQDWRSYFEDVYGYCALAREGYEDEVIEVNGDAARERFMRSHIYDKNLKKPIVVVTGGFHTPALLKAVDEKPFSVTTPKSTDNQWLIRFSFDQLDALNGYGAGVSSPFYYQTLWHNLNCQSEDYLEQTAASMLIAIAHDNRKQQLSEVISSADVQAAVNMAHGLAELRDINGPGRSEIQEAVQSCFIKQAVDHSLQTLVDARRVMCGDQLGQVCRELSQHPLIEQVRALCDSFGLNMQQTQAVDIELHIYQKPKHKKMSRFFHLMQWVSAGFCYLQGGPDFVNGTRLGLVKEHWRYAWTPQVESQLLAQIAHGCSLQEVALYKLRQVELDRQKNGIGRQSSTVTQLLIRACLMGLHTQVGVLAQSLSSCIGQDQDMASLAICGQQLMTLQTGKAFLDGNALQINVSVLLNQASSQLLFLMPLLAGLNAEAGAKALPGLKAHHHFVHQVDDDNSLYYSQLQQLVDDVRCPPIIQGSCLGLLLISGQCEVEAVNDYLACLVQPNQSAQTITGFLRGLIFVAKALLWRVPQILAQLNTLVCTMPEDQFLNILPSMRFLFTELSPKEVDKVAEQVANINGVKADKLSDSLEDFSLRERQLLPQIESLVMNDLANSALKDWFDE
jgi:hypothetical protein